MAMTPRDERLLDMIAEGPYEVDDDDDAWTNDDSDPCPYCGLDLWSQRGAEIVCGSCGLVIELFR